MIKLLPHTSMCQPLFPRNFYSNFCLWEIFFASFCGLLKITFVPHSSLFFHQRVALCRWAWKLQKRALLVIVPHKFHNFGASLAHHPGVLKTLASPLSLLHPLPHLPPGGSFSGNYYSSLGFFISSCLILTPQLPLFSAQVVLKRKLSPNYVFENNLSLYKISSFIHSFHSVSQTAIKCLFGWFVQDAKDTESVKTWPLA